MLGVVVGRFQVPELHEAHKALFEFVSKHSSYILPVIGFNKFREYRPSAREPLSATSRMYILQKSNLPGTILSKVILMPDCSSDQEWSNELDLAIEAVQGEFGLQEEPVMLFGGRDSFITHYFGKFPTFEVKLKGLEEVSGTDTRLKLISDSNFYNLDFVKGYIYAQSVRKPLVYPCVDIGVVSNGLECILLGRKQGEALWRLPGGFVDSTDSSYEQAARRELMEETGIEAGALINIGSFNIKDWRLKGDEDSIISALFY